MKKWKYVSGISSACIGLYMIFRLFLAELGNIMSIDNFKIPLFNVIFVSIVSVTAGCVSIIYAESENKKGNIISLCMNVIATYVLFFLRKSELDLLIFGIWFLICSFMNFIAFFVKDDKNKETIKQKQTLDTGETSVEWEISPETSKLCADFFENESSRDTMHKQIKNQRENMEVEKRIQLKEIYYCPKCGISIDKKQDDYRAMCNNCNFNFEVILIKED